MHVFDWFLNFFCACLRLIFTAVHWNYPFLWFNEGTGTSILRVGLTRISFQLPVSDLGEWRQICHFFRWQTMWRVTFVTFLGRMWRSCIRIFFNLWLFLLHPSRKTSLFGPAGTKLFETGRNVTIRLGLKHSYSFPSQICHLSQKREGHLG